MQDGYRETGQKAWDLTCRELQVLAAVAKGHPNRRIASELFISEETVKKHLKSIYRKLGVRNRSEALAKYLLDHRNAGRL